MPRKKGKPSRAEKLAHLDAAIKYVTNFDTAVDVGAHWGLWTERMAEHFGKVFAFEPMTENYQRLTDRVGSMKNVELCNFAVGQADGSCRMDGEGHSQHYAVFDNNGSVLVAALDSLPVRSVGLIKTDAEGADLLVLKGAEEILKRDRPVLIVERLRKFEKRYGLSRNELPDYLTGLGYAHAETLWCDHIYVPR